MKTKKTLGYTLVFFTVLTMTLLPSALAGTYNGVKGTDSELCKYVWFTKRFALGNEYKVNWVDGVNMKEQHTTSFRGYKDYKWLSKEQSIVPTTFGKDHDLAYYGRAGGLLEKIKGGGQWDVLTKAYSISTGKWKAYNSGDYPSGSTFWKHGISSWD